MMFVFDCGEKSYVGSGCFKDCKVLVIGGDFGIGCVVVIVYVCEGVDVVINYLLVEEEDV